MSITLNVEATYDYYLGAEHPQSITFVGPERATLAEAEADLALLPKGANFRLHTLGSSFGPDANFRVDARTSLRSTKVTGGVNETGLKRVRATFRAADKQGIILDFGYRCSNAYQTRAAFEAGLAAQAAR